MASTQTRPRRIFFDSSVLIAASISDRGRARDLLVHTSHELLIMLVSEFVLAETERNLAAKVPLALPTFNVLRQILVVSLDPPEHLFVEAAQVVAIKDAPIVAAAAHASRIHSYL